MLEWHLFPTTTRFAACILLLTASNSCRAFQVPPALQQSPSRVLVPRRPGRTPRNEHLLPQQFPNVLRASLAREEDGDAGADPRAVDRGVGTHGDNNGGNAITKLWTRLKRRVLSARPAALLLSLSVFLLASAFPAQAGAVQSGGRMGGSFGGCGGSPGCGRMYGAPSGSSYSRGYGYGRGYPSGYYSRPDVLVRPGINPFYSPFYSRHSPIYARPSGAAVSTGQSFFVVGFFLMAATVLSKIITSASDPFGNAIGGTQSVLGPGVSVAEISVALLVPDRDSPDSILAVMDRLSRTARTDSRVGLQNLTSQVTMELLRRRSSVVAASTRAGHFRDGDGARREYNDASIQQRSKFERETVSRFGGVDYSDAGMKSARPLDHLDKATVAVVTIVMMIDGDSTSKKLSPQVNSSGDVEEVLRCIAADAKADGCLRGAEILWTPEDRDETLTMKEVLVDYPSMRWV